MTRLWGRIAVAALIMGLAAPAWANERTGSGKKTAEKGTAKLELPHLEYQHTTQFNNPGIFKLDGEKGTADYVFNKQRHKDDLVFVRNATVAGQPGWVYQVERNGKKENLWFFFASTAVKTPTGGETYQMFYSTQPETGNRKQAWTPILTPTGTRATRLDRNLDKKDDQ